MFWMSFLFVILFISNLLLALYFPIKPIISYFKFICRESDLPLIVAIDLQPMAPIEGVIQVQGDITNARTAEVVRTAFKSMLYIFIDNEDKLHVMLFKIILPT
jgi:hypothetical protein